MKEKIAIESIFSLFDEIKKGDSVVFECPCLERFPLGVLLLSIWTKKKEYPLLINETIDLLHVYKKKLELNGIDTCFIDKALVIKIGGVIETGKVIARVPIEPDAIVLLRKHLKIYRRVLEEYKFVINVWLDFPELISMCSGNTDCEYTLFSNVVKYIGDKHRISFYFIPPNLDRSAQFLKRVATKILRLIEIKEGEFMLELENPVYGTSKHVKFTSVDIMEYLEKEGFLKE